MVFERRAFGSLLTAFDQIYNVQSRVDAEMVRDRHHLEGAGARGEYVKFDGHRFSVSRAPGVGSANNITPRARRACSIRPILARMAGLCKASPATAQRSNPSPLAGEGVAAPAGGHPALRATFSREGRRGAPAGREAGARKSIIFASPPCQGTQFLLVVEPPGSRA
jgi:hypothetical protein